MLNWVTRWTSLGTTVLDDEGLGQRKIYIHLVGSKQTLSYIYLSYVVGKYVYICILLALV